MVCTTKVLCPQNLDDLLGRGRVPASSAIDVETFNQFFADKVARVRATTSTTTDV